MSGLGDNPRHDEMLLDLAVLRAEGDDLRAQIARLSAETRASSVERQQQADAARQAMLKAFAQDISFVADRLFRTLKDAPADAAPESLKSLIVGLQLTERELLKVAGEHGLCRQAPTVGEAFDPGAHLAIVGQATPGATIIGVVAPGYSFHGEVLRPATVLLEDRDQDAEATLRWLQELSLPLDDGPSIEDRPEIPQRYVAIGSPGEERPFNREGVTALLAQLKPQPPASPSRAPAERRKRATIRRAPAPRPSPAPSRRKAVRLGAVVVLSAMALTLVVLPNRSANLPRNGAPKAAGPYMASVTAPRAVQRQPEPPVELDVLPQPVAETAAAPKRSLPQQAPRTVVVMRPSAPAPRPYPEARSPAPLSDAEFTAPVALAQIEAAEPSPVQAAPRPIVLAQVRQSSSELGSLLSGGRSGLAPTRVSLDVDTKQRLSATLAGKGLP